MADAQTPEPQQGPAPEPKIVQVPLPGAPEPVAAAAPADPATPPAKPTEPVAESKPDWKMAEITRLREKLKEARKVVAPDAAPKGATETQEEFDARLETEVNRRLAARQWDDRMNEIVRQGKEKFPGDFSDRVKAIRELLDPNDPAEVAQYRTMLAAAAETGMAPEIIHTLGADPTRFREVLGEPPLKMAQTLGAIAAELKAPEPVSRAPKPVRPVGSSGLHFEEIKPDDAKSGMRLPIKEWMARREKQARANGMQ